jgi:hypothetical protein
VRSANPREEALARWERGKEFFQEGDMAAAVIEFRRAYELFPNFKILYNIGQVCYEQQDYPCALRNFSKYLAEGGSAVAPARVAELQREIDRLNARVAHVTVTTTPPGAEIAVDDMVVGKSPLSAPIIVSAGRRRISASLRGHLSTSKTIEVGGMEQPRVALDLAPIAATTTAIPTSASASATRMELKSAPLERRSRHAGPSSWYWLGPGIGGALATGFAVTALVEWKRWDAARHEPTTFPGDLDAMSARTQGFAITADVIGGLTIASAAVLVGLQVYAKRRATGTHASLGLDIAGNGVALAGQF